MINLTRARDCAATLVLILLNQRHEETHSGASPVRQNQRAAA
jgi:hypothetical protein